MTLAEECAQEYADYAEIQKLRGKDDRKAILLNIYGHLRRTILKEARWYKETTADISDMLRGASGDDKLYIRQALPSLLKEQGMTDISIDNKFWVSLTWNRG